MSNNEADDVTHSATQEALTSSTAVTSPQKYDDDADNAKLRCCCFSCDDPLSTAADLCRYSNCQRSTCSGHVVPLGPCGVDGAGSDVTTVHDLMSTSGAGTLSLPAAHPLHLKACPPSLIQSPGVCASSSLRATSTTTAAAMAAAFQRRLLVEALRRSHGYVDTAPGDAGSTPVRGELVSAPTANYAAAAAASAAAVLSTQLAIHAWFRTALQDARASPLRLGAADSRHDWIRRPPTTLPLPLMLPDVGRNWSSRCGPVVDADDDVASQLNQTSRPASELCHIEHMVSEMDDD